MSKTIYGSVAPAPSVPFKNAAPLTTTTQQELKLLCDSFLCHPLLNVKVSFYPFFVTSIYNPKNVFGSGSAL